MGIGKPVARRDGRDRLLEGAAMLLGERGYAATELRDVAERGDAPRGSIYHHFPDGKAQLAAEAAARRAEQIAVVLERSLDEHGVLATIDVFGGFFRTAAEGDAARVGCPVAAIAAAGGDDPRLREVAAAAFTRWEDLVAGGLRREGMKPAAARSVAALTLSTVEGALLRARASGDLSAIDEALDGLRSLVAPQLRPPRR